MGQSVGAGSGWDYYTAKYSDGDGSLIWERRYNGIGNGFDSALAVALDDTGDVFVAVSFDFEKDKYRSRLLRQPSHRGLQVHACADVRGCG